MRKLFILLPLLAAAATAACSSGPAEPAANASFIPQSNAIQVTVTGGQPLRIAQLIGPAGEVTPASSINTERRSSGGSYYGGGPSVGFGLGGFGGSRGGGGFGSSIGIGIPLGGGASDPGYDRVVSSAAFALPDPVGYRSTWQSYRIELQIGDPPAVRTLTLAAPPPPG
jgi:hypothetical protein